MNKTVVAVVAILATSCLIGLYIWVSNNRYHITTGVRGVAYQVDKKTGESWMLAGETKIRQQGDAECEHNERELPYEQASQITGTARLGHGAFSGQLYNGSDWTITRVVINISAKEDDETIRWSRDFSETLTVNPLTTESFSVAVAGDRGIQNAPWQIKHVFGCKE